LNRRKSVFIEKQLLGSHTLLLLYPLHRAG
jgi:hypothetical protein